MNASDFNSVLQMFSDVFHLMSTTVILRYKNFVLTPALLAVSFTVFTILLEIFLGGVDNDTD